MNLNFCPNKASKEFREMSNIFGEDAAYFLWMRNKGNHLEKAPNGADSKLFQTLLDHFNGNRSEAIKAKAKTYTNEFINWFGDWGGFKTIDTKNDLFTSTGEVNWKYFEQLLDSYHNNQPDSMFSHGRYTLATRPENHFTGEKNTLNHIKFVTQSMLNLLEGKYDMDLPFVSEARASMQNQKDLMILAAMFHDAAKPYRHGDIHGWESADILRDILGVDYDNRVAEWAVRHHMPMPFSHKAEFSLSNPEAIEVAKNIARDARRVGIDANTAINAFVLINAADVINGRELNVDDNWAKKAGEEGLKKYNGDISVKNVLSIELKEKVALLKKAFDEIKDEDFGDTAYNYSHQERFDYNAFPEGGREDKKLPYLNNTEYTGVSKVVDENGEPLVVYHCSNYENDATKKGDWSQNALPYATYFAPYKYAKNEYYYAAFLNIKNPVYEHPDLSEDAIQDEDNFRKYVLDGGYDGIIASYDKNTNAYKAKEIVVTQPNQIKSAVANKQDITTGESGFSTEDDNIYHNLESQDDIDQERKLFADHMDRQNKWLSKQDYMSMSNKQRKILKDNLHKWFDQQGFKHFRLIFGFDKNNYVLYGQRGENASRDASDVDWLQKLTGISVLDNSPKTLSDEEMGELFQFLDLQVRGQSQHIKDVVNVVKQALKGHSINIQFVNHIDGGIAAQYNYFANTITISRSSVFRNDNGMSNVVSQTLLHELIHAVTVNTIQRSPELRQQLQNLFNKVKNSSVVAYYNAEHNYGLTNMYEFLAELSDKNFVDLLQNIHTGSERKSLISQIKDFIHKVVNKIFTRINAHHLGNAYADAMEMFVKAALPGDFDIDINNKVQDDQTIFNTISSRQQAAEAEAKRIAVRMNVLYREYEKNKSKTPSQERLANQIFEVSNELKQHMDISAVGIALEQAKLTLGQYDPNLNGPAQMQHSNIYKYLYDKSQQNYQGVTPDQLVDMYRNSIKFYQDLIEGIPSDREIDLSSADKRNIEQIQSLIKNYIMPLWVEAITKVGDDIVDAQIDQEVEASDQDKEDMKKVAKDWLHRNVMYGDLNVVSNYIYNYSYSSNPIIKQAFHLIQNAEQMTLEEMHHIAPKLIKAYQKANSGARSFTPGWQSMMMEFDDEGKPTGNFIRDINYGLYQKDLKQFRETLNSDFLDDYGFTYVTDDTGAIVNSLTGEYAEDEEWGPNGEMPEYIEYQRAIEIFKHDRVFRRFTPDYYLERLTRPYDGTIDPMDPQFKGTKLNHGLSPRTLKRYNYYQSNINYYLNKCQDQNTGLVYPERLSSDDRMSLSIWYQRFDEFKDIFNKDGSYKSGEDLKMAYEVRAWQKWIGERSDSIRFQDTFNDEMNRIYKECVNKGNMQDYNTFMKFNASAGINPDYIEQTVGSFKSYHKDTDMSYRARLLRKALQDSVKTPLQYSRNLMSMRNKPLFWLHCKASDQAIDDAKDPNDKGQSGWTPEQVESYKKNFYNRELLYTDEHGNFIDENGNSVQPNTQLAEDLEDAGKLITVRQKLINEYVDEALRNGYVEGLIDESTGDPIDFSGMTAADIKTQITNLMSYRRRTFEEDGSITEEYVPLTIFSLLWPTSKTFKNKRTGKIERTVVYLGEGRFKESYSSFSESSTNFNPNEGISEKPNTAFDGGRYNNKEKYNEMRKDSSVSELYDLLIQTMKDSQELYSTNRKFNYRLPQINARTVALFSRIIKRGYSEKSISAIWNSIFRIEANDEDMRTKEDYFVGVDGEIANNVPLKFIRNLKNQEDVSTDLVSSVIMFADMAINYKNKSAIDSTLKLLRYNMNEATRATNKNKYGIFGGRKLDSNEYSIEMFDSMMNSHMYGNQWVGKNKQGGPSKSKIATFKTVDAFQSLESGAMLGLNAFSMLVGFGDSLTRIFSESIAGKYMTIGDCLFALGKCLWYTPACIANMFNPLANNKITALMQMNGISKNVYSTYTKTDWGRGRKFLSNLLMGGWSMLDWMANALLMVAFYHNIRFYDGGIVETGFYSKYELQQAFLKAGHTKSEANWAHHNFGNYGRRVTLWDAYYFKDGEAHIRPEYEQYVTQKIKTRVATKTKKRGALYNGMNPDNDVPQWKRDVIGRLVGSLRGWIFQSFQHLFAGGTDNVAINFEDVPIYETTSSGTRMKIKSRKVKLTDEEKSRRFSWDYETGTPQDQIIIGLARSFSTINRKIVQWSLYKPNTAKLSEVEKYAMKDAIIYIAMLSLMMIGWTYVHDWAREVPKPKNRYEAGPMSMANPVDYYNFIRDVYIPNEYWRLAVDDIYFRIIEAKISNIDPFQVSDIVNAATALKSGLDDQLSLLGASLDLLAGNEELDAIQKQGAYKFYTKGEKILYKGIGPFKNIHTFLTYEGATNNLRWYTNKFGKFYRMAGYDFKAKDKEKQQESKTNVGNFQGGNFKGGNLQGGNFKGGNFK